MRAICGANRVQHAVPITQNALEAALADVVDLPRWYNPQREMCRVFWLVTRHGRMRVLPACETRFV